MNNSSLPLQALTNIKNVTTSKKVSQDEQASADCRDETVWLH